MISTICRVIFITMLLSSCGQKPKTEKIQIALNPWPGYEFLYLAAEKGFFEQAGLNVEIVELSSLADVQRIYVQGRIDGFGSTVIEAVRAAGITQHPVRIVLVPDFSFGGDVIIANQQIHSVKELKGMRVGVEMGTLGFYVLHLALGKHGLSLDDVTLVNVEQLDAEKAMANNQIDAMVTYPPYSYAIDKINETKQVFDTRDIPGQVIDTITIRAGVIEDEQQWVNKFHQVWQRAIDYTANNQQEAYEIMAKREGISVAEFADALTGLTVVQSRKQNEMLGSQRLKDNIQDVCRVLEQSKAINFKCDNINQLVQGAVSN